MEIQQKEAAEKRDQLYKRVEESTRNLILLTVKIEELEDRVHKAEDVTRRVVQWEQRGIGMLAMIGIAGTSIGAALAYVLHNLIGGLRLG